MKVLSLDRSRYSVVNRVLSLLSGPRFGMFGFVLLAGLMGSQGALAQTEATVQAAIDGAQDEETTLFLPPPNLEELAEITETAIAPLSQRKTQRSLVIRLNQRRVYVYENDDLMVSYPVAIGKGGWETPKGEWKVNQMLKQPSWQHPWTGEIVPPGPDNPLGRRWIGFWSDGVNAIGFHGTPNENLVGQAVSHGCVRMKNAHIDALFQQIAMGATVRVE